MASSLTKDMSVWKGINLIPQKWITVNGIKWPNSARVMIIALVLFYKSPNFFQYLSCFSYYFGTLTWRNFTNPLNRVFGTSGHLTKSAQISGRSESAQPVMTKSCSYHFSSHEGLLIYNTQWIILIIWLTVTKNIKEKTFSIMKWGLFQHKQYTSFI